MKVCLCACLCVDFTTGIDKSSGGAGKKQKWRTLGRRWGRRRNGRTNGEVSFGPWNDSKSKSGRKKKKKPCSKRWKWQKQNWGGMHYAVMRRGRQLLLRWVLTWKWTEKERLTQDCLDKHKIHNSDRLVGLKDKEGTHTFVSIGKDSMQLLCVYSKKVHRLSTFVHYLKSFWMLDNSKLQS